uniref:NADH dehydrogenase subunit 6 n=1 Tax=Ledra trigona TaxID=2901394 RepID=A0A8K2ATY3_9HEMI|nr:NADH dehydrogenase subunit 6 [Ledra trigona]
MKFLVLSLIIFSSSLCCFLSNPMSMGLLLLIYSFLISFMIGKVMVSSWFCIVLVLVMIGGLLVIFMYVSSISSNESFNLNLLFLLGLILIFLFFFEDFLLENQSFDLMKMMSDLNLSESFSLVKLYNGSCFILTFFLIIYLIFCMVVVSSIVKHFSGPLRSFNYEQIFI